VIFKHVLFFWLWCVTEPKVVMGQYMLWVCCAQKKPVIIFYSNNMCWLFVEEIFQQPTSFHAQYYNTIIWTLVNLVDTPSPPQDLLHMACNILSYAPHIQCHQDGTKYTGLCLWQFAWWTHGQRQKDMECKAFCWHKYYMFLIYSMAPSAPFHAPGVPLMAIDHIFDQPHPASMFQNTEIVEYA